MAQFLEDFTTIMETTTREQLIRDRQEFWRVFLYNHYGHYDWFIYAAEMLSHREKSVAMVRKIDAKYAELLDNNWPFVICQLMQHIAIHIYDDRHISGVEDVTIMLHNMIAPGTKEGDGLKKFLSEDPNFCNEI